jgi:hypothetical protein
MSRDVSETTPLHNLCSFTLGNCKRGTSLIWAIEVKFQPDSDAKLNGTIFNMMFGEKTRHNYEYYKHKSVYATSEIISIYILGNETH